MLRWFEHSQVYHPDRTMMATGAELGRRFEDVWFQAADGLKLNGWFYPAAINSLRATWAMLVCHGNAGNISQRLELCQILLTTGVNVFLFDYRGFGQSQGWPSEEGTYLDAEAAHQWLESKGFAGQNILVFGESLGGGVASELGLRRQVGGIVLQGTFTSIPDIGAELFPWLPVRLLARIKYETCRKLPRLKVPVLVMHSRTDGLIGFGHAEANFAAANQPKLLCEIKGDHNDPLEDREGFLAGVEKFLGLVEVAGGQGYGAAR
jgi:pimeloyl-ACP methyl ester carboxylesterase